MIYHIKPLNVDLKNMNKALHNLEFKKKHYVFQLFCKITSN
jgi:hypothetical protein